MTNQLPPQEPVTSREDELRWLKSAAPVHDDIRNAETVHEAVYLALGAASMCWDTPPQGVFKPEQADAVGKALLDRITGGLDIAADASLARAEVGIYDGPRNADEPTPLGTAYVEGRVPDPAERYEDLLYLDHTSQLILAEWAKHRAAKLQEWDTDYAAHIDHIRLQADRWEATNSAYWTLLGSRLANDAIEQWEANHASD